MNEQRALSNLILLMILIITAITHLPLLILDYLNQRFGK